MNQQLRTNKKSDNILIGVNQYQWIKLLNSYYFLPLFIYFNEYEYTECFASNCIKCDGTNHNWYSIYEKEIKGNSRISL